jgi:hypothetical protein
MRLDPKQRPADYESDLAHACSLLFSKLACRIVFRRADSCTLCATICDDKCATEWSSMRVSARRYRLLRGHPKPANEGHLKTANEEGGPGR